LMFFFQSRTPHESERILNVFRSRFRWRGAIESSGCHQ
jgi:hypothetical protein